jgi:hypothetical protein
MKSRSPTYTLPRRRILGQLASLGGLTFAQALLAREVWAQALECSDFVHRDGFEFGPSNACVLIPSETAGPYPLLSLLSDPAVIRRNITEGLPGLPLLYRLRVVNLNNSCAPVPNVAVYLWQTDRDGRYSGYTQPGGVNTVGQRFCRGVQFTDCNGVVEIEAMFPGWYAGRITHTHFQVYPNLSGNPRATSQLAFPIDITQAIYAVSANYPRGQSSFTSFSQDGIFSDGVANQLVSMSGDPNTGYVAALTVGITI